MDAWNTLLSTSTASSGADAWVHLNSQGGGGNIIQVVAPDTILVDFSETAIELLDAGSEIGITSQAAGITVTTTATEIGTDQTGTEIDVNTD